MRADKLLDAANVAAGALVFGQFLADRFSIVLVVAGLGVWGLLVAIALALVGGDE
jgi:hypothetical protein